MILFIFFFVCVGIIVTTTLVNGTNAVTLLIFPFIACLVFSWSISKFNETVYFYGIIPVYGKHFPVFYLIVNFFFH
ncbi:hypothetical protein, partial [Streptomyces afghaniensis]|uniref:hypothetical protein n=1 Tax=Streptomyces afghaniensis TaxID=66865 RepID=UPI0012B69C2C